MQLFYRFSYPELRLLDIDLGDYYRTYIALKNRKKDRTAFLRHLVECLERRMDEEYDV